MILTHTATINVSEYFKSRKLIKKLANEINFYKGKKAHLHLVFSNISIKASDLIFFFKKLKISFNEFANMTTIEEADQFFVADIAHEILTRRKFLNLKTLYKFLASLVGLAVLIVISYLVVTNINLFVQSKIIKSKIIYLLDRDNMYNELEVYYKRTNIQISNNYLNLEQTLDNISYDIAKNCKKFGICDNDINYAIAIPNNESHFDKLAKSNIPIIRNGQLIRTDHAFGYYQVYYNIWRDTIKIDDAELMYDDYYNSYWGLYIFKQALDNSKGDIYKALLSYAGGYRAIEGDRSILKTEVYEHLRKIIRDANEISKIYFYEHKKVTKRK